MTVPTRRPLAAVALTLVTLVTFGFAATSPLPPVVRPETPRPRALGETVSIPPPSAASASAPASATPSPEVPHVEIPGYLAMLIIGLLMAMGAVVLWLLYSWLRNVRMRRDERRRADARNATDAHSLDAEAIADDLERTASGTGCAGATISGDDIIIEAWRRLERSAQELGTPRALNETSTAFTASVIKATGADPQAVTELGELYREAMFSEHHLVTADHARAQAAIARIVETLRGRR